MRSPTRIAPIMDLVTTIWMLNPDLRLGQLIGNADIWYNTEDVNSAIEKLCLAYNLEFKHWALWWINYNWVIIYKKIDSLSTAHLKNILRQPYVGARMSNLICDLLEEREEESIIDNITDDISSNTEKFSAQGVKDFINELKKRKF